METAGLEQSTSLFNRQIVTTWENVSIIYSDSTTQPDSGLKIAAIAAAVKLLTHFCWTSETRDFQKMVLMMTKMRKKSKWKHTTAAKYIGMRGWQARKKSYNRTTWRKSDSTCPNQVMSQLRAKMVPTSALLIKWRRLSQTTQVNKEHPSIQEMFLMLHNDDQTGKKQTSHCVLHKHTKQTYKSNKKGAYTHCCMKSYTSGLTRSMMGIR